MPNKSLGQHWLKDPAILGGIADCADIVPSDTVVEIGPGLGTLTSALLRRADKVIAVEFDAELARKLPGQFPGKNLEVRNEDILSFDTSGLPHVYKVVGNIPYYITAKIVHKFTTCTNMPSLMVFLVQKEVAERLAAQPGDMSILAVAAQVDYDVSLGPVVDAVFFTPPPKVDSQVVVLKRRHSSIVSSEEQKLFFRVVKAGFSERRKKLRSSLAGGLGLDKRTVDILLDSTNIDPEARAQELSLEQWRQLTATYSTLQ